MCSVVSDDVGVVGEGEAAARSERSHTTLTCTRSVTVLRAASPRSTSPNTTWMASWAEDSVGVMAPNATVSTWSRQAHSGST